MKLKHYSFFSEGMQAINSRENWNSVRENAKEPHYFIPASVPGYETLPSVAGSVPLAKWIVEKMMTTGSSSLYSVGCGVAYVEYNCKKMAPSFHITVSDFTPSVARLKSLQMFDEVIELDMIQQTPVLQPGSIMYLGRIDTELSDEQLSGLFHKFHAMQVQNICMVPAQLLTWKAAAIELYIGIKSLLLQKKKTFCGYNRSISLFRKLITPYYRMAYEEVKGSPVFWLSKK